ncbi:MAG: hypothetical protein K0U93_25935, partial [Gammaproteobacteria bacterium]|nr:hypothetical protein [Gammaproteobacteria bacterium]
MSVGYSPLEQFATDRRHQGPWTDVYALGATAYHMMLGERPVSAEERGLDMLSAAPDRAAERIEQVSHQYSGEFVDAVQWAIRIRFNERPQTISQWRSALGGFAPHSIPRDERRVFSAPARVLDPATFNEIVFAKALPAPPTEKRRRASLFARLMPPVNWHKPIRLGLAVAFVGVVPPRSPRRTTNSARH